MKSLGKIPALLLVVLTCAVGYLTFRYFYHIGDQFPFSQELILVFIGTIATVLITAVLLNQQTELELKKEGRVLLMERKASIYFALIDQIGEIVEKKRLELEALYDLRVLNHKLAVIGGEEVIRHFNEVLDALEAATRDERISTSDQTSIMREVAELTYYMRRDLIGEIDGKAAESEVMRDIIANNEDLERP